MKLEYLFFIPVILELMAAVTATVLYDKYKDAPEKYFLYFLWYTFLVEVIGAILKRYFGILVWFFPFFPFSRLKNKRWPNDVVPSENR